VHPGCVWATLQALEDTATSIARNKNSGGENHSRERYNRAVNFADVNGSTLKSSAITATSILGIVVVPAVWADVDFKDISRQKLFDRLKNFLCKPSMIVKSGNGVHFYFLLSQPARPEDFARVVDVNKRIALCLNGDLNATDAARVLRPPETKNLKYSPPRLVELSLIDRFEYDLQYFEDELPKPDKQPIHHTSTGISTNRPGWLVDALKGVSSGQRNSTGAKIAGYFVNKLHTDDLLTIIEAWNSHNQPPLPEADILKIVQSVGRYRNIKHAKKKKARIEIHSF